MKMEEKKNLQKLSTKKTFKKKFLSTLKKIRKIREKLRK